jgi:Na+/proline symporter
VRIARVGVLSFGMIAYALALTSNGVHALVEEASAFGGAGVFVVILLALYTRIGSNKSAMASLLGGAITWSAGHFVFEVQTPYLLSMLVSLLSYLSVAAAEHHLLRRTP